MSLPKSCTVSRLRSPETTTLSVALGQHLGAGLHRRLHQRGDLHAQRVDLPLERLAHFFDRQAGVVGVEEVGGLGQFACW